MFEELLELYKTKAKEIEKERTESTSHGYARFSHREDLQRA